MASFPNSNKVVELSFQFLKGSLRCPKDKGKTTTATTYDNENSVGDAMRSSWSEVDAEGADEEEENTESDIQTNDSRSLDDAFFLDCAEWWCHALLSSHDGRKFDRLDPLLKAVAFPTRGRAATRLLALALWHTTLEQLTLAGSGYVDGNLDTKKSVLGLLRPNFVKLEEQLDIVKVAFLKDDANEWYKFSNSPSSLRTTRHPSRQELKRPPFHGYDMFNKNYRYIVFLIRVQQKFSNLLQALRAEETSNNVSHERRIARTRSVMDSFRIEWDALIQEFDDCFSDQSELERSKHDLSDWPWKSSAPLNEVSEQIMNLATKNSNPFSFFFLRQKLQGLLQTWCDAVLSKPIFVQLGYRPDGDFRRSICSRESHLQRQQSSPMATNASRKMKTRPDNPPGKDAATHNIEIEYEHSCVDHRDSSDRSKDKGRSTLPVPSLPHERDALPSVSSSKKRHRPHDKWPEETNGHFRISSTRRRSPGRRRRKLKNPNVTPRRRDGRLLPTGPDNGKYIRDERHIVTSDNTEPNEGQIGTIERPHSRTSKSDSKSKDPALAEIVDLWEDSDDDSSDLDKGRIVKSEYCAPKKVKIESSPPFSPEAFEIVNEARKGWDDSSDSDNDMT